MSVGRQSLNIAVEPRPRAPGRPIRLASRHRWAWWAPLSCRDAVAGVASRGPYRWRIGVRCGSQGCAECAPSARAASIGSVAELEIEDDYTAFLVTLTPRERVRTGAAYDEFLARVRSVVRSMSRADRGEPIWSGGVVAVEAVPKWGEGSAVMCPVRTIRAPATDAKACEARRVCMRGGACRYCRGRGVLPAVHLHAHLLVVGRRHWYGRGTILDALASSDLELRKAGRAAIRAGAVHCPGGVGLASLVDAAGLGIVDVQRVESRGAVSRYIGKAAGQYLAKVTSCDGHQERESLAAVHGAWAAAGRGVSRRLLWRFGSWHGWRVRTRDPSLRVALDFGTEAAAGGGGVAQPSPPDDHADVSRAWDSLSMRMSGEWARNEGVPLVRVARLKRLPLTIRVKSTHGRPGVRLPELRKRVRWWEPWATRDSGWCVYGLGEQVLGVEWIGGQNLSVSAWHDFTVAAERVARHLARLHGEGPCAPGAFVAWVANRVAGGSSVFEARCEVPQFVDWDLLAALDAERAKI